VYSAGFHGKKKGENGCTWFLDFTGGCNSCYLNGCNGDCNGSSTRRYGNSSNSPSLDNGSTDFGNSSNCCLDNMGSWGMMDSKDMLGSFGNRSDNN
jgi:hypothetical protein